jgi:hypothetical protein
VSATAIAVIASLRFNNDSESINTGIFVAKTAINPDLGVEREQDELNFFQPSGPNLCSTVAAS